MSDNNWEQQTDDYSRTTVPADQTVGGLRVAAILLGIFIALPGFVNGAMIGSALGLKDAIVAFVIAGAILTLLGMATSMVGMKSRISTYMIIEFAFGRSGARLINLIMASTMIGWFGVNAFYFGQALIGVRLMQTSWFWNETLTVLVGSFLMIATTFYGFQALSWLSRVAVPFLMLALFYVAYISWDPSLEGKAVEGAGLSLGYGISAVVGGVIVGVATLPDTSRYLHDWKAVFVSVVITFLVGVPIVLGSSMLPSLATGSSNLIDITVGLGFGSVALFVIMFATWTSNTANLYSASLSLAASFSRVSRWQLALWSGGCGTILALMDVEKDLIGFLLLLSALIPPVASIYVVDFYLFSGRKYDVARLNTVPGYKARSMLAWFCGAVVAMVGVLKGWSVTGVPACDGALVSFLVLYVSKIVQERRSLDAECVK